MRSGSGDNERMRWKIKVSHSFRVKKKKIVVSSGVAVVVWKMVACKLGLGTRR